MFVGGDHGLFHRDTRLLSRWQLTVSGETPTLVSSTQPESDSWLAVLRVARPGGRPEGPDLPQDALEIVIRRTVAAGLSERIDVVNQSALPYRATLRIALDADFADRSEVGRARRQQGTIERDVRAGLGLRLRYRVAAGDREDERGLDIGAEAGGVAVHVTGKAFSIPLDLPARGRAQVRLAYRPIEEDGGVAMIARTAERRARQRATWRARRPLLVCDDRLGVPFERAAEDLFDLRNWELEAQLLGSTSGESWLLNAGVPTFTGLFGRDVITSGWQSAMLGPRALAGALDAVADTQATADDPWRDAEPGKLIHERRFGPLAALGLTPRDAYYGTQTTATLFVLALSELWHWTGDEGILRRHVDVAQRAMDWARTAGDLDGDGFLEYLRRSPQGLRNQAWKDSDEAIRHADGSIVEGPVATVEEQAFHILAIERLAEILLALEDDAGAADCLERARTLRDRWHAAFWMPDERFYALALDGDKQQVRTITSNPGHALGAGIVPRESARAVADRLLDDDLFSGWGVRTLSSRHPSYNPFAYHLGSVWPVEQATFALGFKRYGLDDHLDRLVDAVIAAADASEHGRLPEALTGHSRIDVPTPVPYPDANSPQAWSASALVQLVQVLLGLYPYAPLRTLAVVRPRLPAWLPELTVRRLRVGRATVDLRFRRRPDGSASWRVLRTTGPVVVVPGGPPNDVGAGSWLERAARAGLDRAPGRLVRAARIAIGRETSRER